MRYFVTIQVMNQLNLLAISGSLRAASSNLALLTAATSLAPADVSIEIYGNMGALPHFNPDDEGENAPAIVADLRARVIAADGLLICTPEYVHGLPGSFKNLLDWLVSGGELWDKPVAIISVANRGAFANASLLEILKTLMAQVSERASVEVPMNSNRVDVAALLADAEIAGLLRECVANLAREIGDL